MSLKTMMFKKVKAINFEKLDKLISIQEDICKTLEIGYNLCL